MEELRVTLVQTDLVWESPARNLEILGKKIPVLKGHTDLIVLPEMFATGFSLQAERVAEEFSLKNPGRALKWMKETARDTDAALAGSLAVKEGASFYNRFVFVRPDGSVETYDKRHLFRYLGEDQNYSAGVEPKIVTWREWRISLQVCYDLRFPVWCRNTENYDVMLFVANWPKERHIAWETLLRARAIENQAYVIGVNRVGTDGNGLEYQGGSAVIGPDGSVRLDADTEKGVLSTGLSLGDLRKFRSRYPFLSDRDSFLLQR